MFPIASTDVIQLTLTLKMTNAQVVETSATVNNQPCSRDNVHPDDHIQYSTYKMTSNGVQTFTIIWYWCIKILSKIVLNNDSLKYLVVQHAILLFHDFFVALLIGVPVVECSVIWKQFILVVSCPTLCDGCEIVWTVKPCYWIRTVTLEILCKALDL